MGYRDSAKRRARDKRHYRKNRSKIIARKIAYQRANSDHVNHVRRARYRTPQKRMMALFVDAKKRAKRANLPFEQAVADHFIALPPQKCECCGKIFDYAQASSAARKYSPSVDRIQGSLGYIVGNVAVICYRCNTIKQDASWAEIHLVAIWVQSRVT